MNGRMLLLGAYYGPSLIVQKQLYPRYLELLTFIEIYFPLTKDSLIILSKTLIFWRWMKTVNAHLHPDSQHICFSAASPHNDRFITISAHTPPRERFVVYRYFQRFLKHARSNSWHLADFNGYVEWKCYDRVWQGRTNWDMKPNFLKLLLCLSAGAVEKEALHDKAEAARA